MLKWRRVNWDSRKWCAAWLFSFRRSEWNIFNTFCEHFDDMVHWEKVGVQDVCVCICVCTTARDRTQYYYSVLFNAELLELFKKLDAAYALVCSFSTFDRCAFARMYSGLCWWRSIFRFQFFCVQLPKSICNDWFELRQSYCIRLRACVCVWNRKWIRKRERERTELSANAITHSKCISFVASISVIRVYST